MTAKERPSKSAARRAALARLDMAKSLLDMDTRDLDKLSLSTSLRDEIDLGRRLTRSAKVRQARRIAKLLDNDPDALAAIENRLSSEQARAHADRQQFKSLEKLREALIRGDRETTARLEAQLDPRNWAALQSELHGYHSANSERARKTHYRSVFKRLASALQSTAT